MAGRRRNEIEKIQGRLTVTQALWEYERERILRALGFDEDIRLPSKDGAVDQNLTSWKRIFRDRKILALRYAFTRLASRRYLVP
jgi:hypothetical protein